MYETTSNKVKLEDITWAAMRCSTIVIIFSALCQVALNSSVAGINLTENTNSSNNVIIDPGNKTNTFTEATNSLNISQFYTGIFNQPQTVTIQKQTTKLPKTSLVTLERKQFSNTSSINNVPPELTSRAISDITETTVSPNTLPISLTNAIKPSSANTGIIDTKTKDPLNTSSVSSTSSDTLVSDSITNLSSNTVSLFTGYSLSKPYITQEITNSSKTSTNWITKPAETTYIITEPNIVNTSSTNFTNVTPPSVKISNIKTTDSKLISVLSANESAYPDRLTKTVTTLTPNTLLNHLTNTIRPPLASTSIINRSTKDPSKTLSVSSFSDTLGPVSITNSFSETVPSTTILITTSTNHKTLYPPTTPKTLIETTDSTNISSVTYLKNSTSLLTSEKTNISTTLQISLTNNVIPDSTGKANINITPPISSPNTLPINFTNNRRQLSASSKIINTKINGFSNTSPVSSTSSKILETFSITYPSSGTVSSTTISTTVSTKHGILYSPTTANNLIETTNFTNPSSVTYPKNNIQSLASIINVITKTNSSNTSSGITDLRSLASKNNFTVETTSFPNTLPIRITNAIRPFSDSNRIINTKTKDPSKTPSVSSTSSDTLVPEGKTNPFSPNIPSKSISSTTSTIHGTLYPPTTANTLINSTKSTSTLPVTYPNNIQSPASTINVTIKTINTPITSFGTSDIKVPDRTSDLTVKSTSFPNTSLILFTNKNRPPLASSEITNRETATTASDFTASSDTSGPGSITNLSSETAPSTTILTTTSTKHGTLYPPTIYNNLYKTSRFTNSSSVTYPKNKIQSSASTINVYASKTPPIWITKPAGRTNTITESNLANTSVDHFKYVTSSSVNITNTKTTDFKTTSKTAYPDKLTKLVTTVPLHTLTNYSTNTIRPPSASTAIIKTTTNDHSNTSSVSSTNSDPFPLDSVTNPSSELETAPSSNISTTTSRKLRLLLQPTTQKTLRTTNSTNTLSVTYPKNKIQTPTSTINVTIKTINTTNISSDITDMTISASTSNFTVNTTSSSNPFHKTSSSTSISTTTLTNHETLHPPTTSNNLIETNDSINTSLVSYPKNKIQSSTSTTDVTTKKIYSTNTSRIADYDINSSASTSHPTTKAFLGNFLHSSPSRSNLMTVTTKSPNPLQFSSPPNWITNSMSKRNITANTLVNYFTSITPSSGNVNNTKTADFKTSVASVNETAFSNSLTKTMTTEHPNILTSTSPNNGIQRLESSTYYTTESNKSTKSSQNKLTQIPATHDTKDLVILNVIKFDYPVIQTGLFMKSGN